MDRGSINSFQINERFGRGGVIRTYDPLRPRRGYGQFFQLHKSLKNQWPTAKTSTVRKLACR